MYVCINLPLKKNYLQVIIINMKSRYNTKQYNTIQRNAMQYNTINFKAGNIKGKTPLITVAGMALKGQADLISIMVPLEMLVYQKR